ncbi:hypothetical protein BCR32DRAFT_265871 [Anaeromyces robustus]|uniref:Mediator of RNA polymerase II transcription subunit 10 n=1 Tax=Anaeromyces robustus TaxID=1754192 RepID=A0A1Y1XH96_9FUNG|nr:hypothetical protein BCR32DRAFT_265871 [Anaeromyces robustus]|eukprot:ORX85120.1 hypothetical protein BCR32DRAFT_265871 [Anaeromyces robustus]
MEDEINIEDIDDLNFDDNFDDNINNDYEDKLVGDPLELLENKTMELINTLYNLNVIVYDFQPSSTQVLHNKINEVVEELKDLDDIKENIDIKIPQELLDDIEQGKNPDIFTNNLIKATVSQNQNTNGKIEAMKLLSNTLQKNIQNILPEDYELYQKLTNEK